VPHTHTHTHIHTASLIYCKGSCVIHRFTSLLSKDTVPHTASHLYYAKTMCRKQLHIFSIRRHTHTHTHTHLHVLIIPTNSGRDFIHHSYSIAMRLKVYQAHTNIHPLSIQYLIPLTARVTINICYFEIFLLHVTTPIGYQQGSHLQRNAFTNMHSFVNYFPDDGL
jgi:hypothetical protein